jgi:hypothetical protein
MLFDLEKIQNPSLPLFSMCTEIEILDINFTKDLSLLLHAINSPVYGRI